MIEVEQKKIEITREYETTYTIDSLSSIYTIKIPAGKMYLTFGWDYKNDSCQIVDNKTMRYVWIPSGYYRIIK